ncbi:MAG: ATP-binding protein [Pseudomonadota bacterium]
MTSSDADASSLPFLQGGGHMGALMRAKDWSSTPLGPAHTWPAPLRVAVSLMLQSRQPVSVSWGPALTYLYNDSYLPICGNKHPAALGQPLAELWRDVWAILGPASDAVRRGEALLFEDMPFDLRHRNLPGLSFFSFSYTPLRDEAGAVAGIFCTALETTEKVRLEQRLIQEVENQRRSFKQAPGFIFTLTGPDHVFEFVNDAHQRLANRPNVVGQPMREAFPDLAAQGFCELLDQVYRSGERYIAHGVPARFQANPQAPEELRRLDFIYAPVFDDEGRVTGIFCEGQDVTEQFEAQCSLREKEEQLRLATEAADVGLWDVDLVSETLFWPPRLKAMFGISPNRTVSMTDFYAGLHPDDAARTAAAFAAACDPSVRAVYDMEYRTIGLEDGVTRWVGAKGRGIFDEDGRCVRVIGTAIDITARKNAEAALRDSEERLRFLDRIGEATRTLTSADAVMAVTARLLGEHLGATRCAYADVEPDNDRFTIRSDWSAPGVPSSVGVYSLDLFGSQATSKLRQGQHLVVCDVDRELAEDDGARMFNAIGIKAIICAGLVKDHRLVAMMAVHQAQPRPWSEQDVAIVVEVVERCWAHIERVRDNAALREQDRRKDEFLATLAHELRNPLAPVKYATSVLRLSEDPERQRQAHEVIERQATHLTRLIDDLMDVSRINRGLIELQRESVSLRSLLQQAVEAARPAIEASRHRLVQVLPPATARLNADATRIVQAVSNLLTNAAKYTPDGGEITLTAQVQGTQAIVEVADNGIGIPTEQQGRLFHMFTQLHPDSARSKGGLGIGLSLVKTLVTMHGGTVQVESDGLDEGSRFILTLPLEAEVKGSAEAVQDGVDELQAPAVRALATRVLVVEDNRDGRETLVELLQILGYQVAAAADGLQGVSVANSFQPQIVLLDLGLPGIDGHEVARRLRADPGHARTSIVALTGWGTDRDRARTQAAGFDAHLTKPVALDTLQQMLGEMSLAAKLV